MVSGLAAAALVSLIMVLMLYRYHHLYWDSLLSYNILWYFIAWCLISCLWSPNTLSSYLIFCKVFVMILSGVFLVTNFDTRLKAEEFISSIRIPLYIGICCTIVVFSIELYSYGMMTNLFSSVLDRASKGFQTHFLDRGCSIITVMSWFVIYLLMKEGRKIFAFGLYAIVLAILVFSDSLSSCLAFLCGGIVFLSLIVSKMYLWRIMLVGLVLTLVSTPFIAYKQDPVSLSSEYCAKVPSAAHRLFIWNFVSHKMMEKPILGYGFNSSRYLSEDKSVHYGEYEFGLLPLHPHNNVLQVFLETGVIGFIFFISIIIRMVVNIFKNSKKELIYQNAAISACMISYLCIGMISFSVWQLWWVATGVFIFMLIQIERKTNIE